MVSHPVPLANHSASRAALGFFSVFFGVSIRSEEVSTDHWNEIVGGFLPPPRFFSFPVDFPGGFGIMF